MVVDPNTDAADRFKTDKAGVLLREAEWGVSDQGG